MSDEWQWQILFRRRKNLSFIFYEIVYLDKPMNTIKHNWTRKLKISNVLAPRYILQTWKPSGEPLSIGRHQGGCKPAMSTQIFLPEKHTVKYIYTHVQCMLAGVSKENGWNFLGLNLWQNWKVKKQILDPYLQLNKDSETNERFTFIDLLISQIFLTELLIVIPLQS